MDCYSWLYTLIIQVCPSLEWQEMTSCHRKISIFLHSYSLQLSCCICGFFVSPNFSSLTLKSEVPHGSQPIHWKKYKASGFGFCIDSRIVLLQMVSLETYMHSFGKVISLQDANFVDVYHRQWIWSATLQWFSHLVLCKISINL